ncbi:MAG: hypothetical protein ABIL58_14885 [Pseudomonadota bacterium]
MKLRGRRPAIGRGIILAAVLALTGAVASADSAAAVGAVRGKPARGRGYLEMTGYAGPFDAPL